MKRDKKMMTANAKDEGVFGVRQKCSKVPRLLVLMMRNVQDGAADHQTSMVVGTEVAWH